MELTYILDRIWAARAWNTNAAHQELIDVLLAKSPLFAQHWREQAVLNREGGKRWFNHLVYGEQCYLQTTLLVALQPECKLVCLARW